MTNFEEQIRAAMAGAARPRPTTDSDWTRLQVKLAAGRSDSAADSGSGRGAIDRDGRTPGRPGSSPDNPSRRESIDPDGSWVRRWRRPLLAAAAVAALAVATVAIVAPGSDGGSQVAGPGAAGGESSGDGSGPASTTVDGLVFAHHPAQNGGDGALLQGVVTDVDGCLAVTADDGASVTVPSFSIPGTDPAALRIGDRVALGGGFVDTGALGEDFVIPDACQQAAGAPDGYFVAWQLTVLPAADGDGSIAGGGGPDTAADPGPGAPAVSVAPTTAAPPIEADPAPRFGPDGPNGADGPFVATYPDFPEGSAYPAALLEGTVAVKHGCVAAQADFGEVFTLIFPQSQIEAAAPPAVVRFNGTDYRVGDAIAFGGGATAFAPVDPTIECPSKVWSVNPE